MPESVELNGMTINLVEDKQTYDAMTKNPNEMYLVEKDYDLEFNVETHFNHETGYDYVSEAALVSGNIYDVLERVKDSEGEYRPRAKINFVAVYNSNLFFYKEVFADCILEDAGATAVTKKYGLVFNTYEGIGSCPTFEYGSIAQLHMRISSNANGVIEAKFRHLYYFFGREEAYYFANDKDIYLE